MIIGKCNNCQNTGTIVPVNNPNGLCPKCWTDGREQENKSKLNEKKIDDFKSFKKR